MPIEVQKTANVVIRDENLAAWMPINNALENKIQSGRIPWNGILIQLGDYKRFPQQTFPQGRELLVDVKRGDEIIDTVKTSDFQEGKVWINVVASNTDPRPLPVDDNKDEDFDSLFPGGSFHKYFRPYTHTNSEEKTVSSGGITIWQDRSLGFELVVSQLPVAYRNQYTFKFKGNEGKFLFVNVITVKDGKRSHENVDEIVIRKKGGGNGDDPLNPPQKKP